MRRSPGSRIPSSWRRSASSPMMRSKRSWRSARERLRNRSLSSSTRMGAMEVEMGEKSSKAEAEALRRIAGAAERIADALEKLVNQDPLTMVEQALQGMIPEGDPPTPEGDEGE